MENSSNKIQQIDQIALEFKERLSALRFNQFEVMKRMVDKNDARVIAKIKQEINSNV